VNQETRCPRCGSTLKMIFRRPCDTEDTFDPWHSTPQPPAPEPQRCAVCGCPLAESVNKGCVRGNCSMRPLPKTAYDPDRANAEYKSMHWYVQTPAAPEQPVSAALHEVEERKKFQAWYRTVISCSIADLAWSGWNARAKIAAHEIAALKEENERLRKEKEC
jgi:hypothetical protein